MEEVWGNSVEIRHKAVLNGRTCSALNTYRKKMPRRERQRGRENNHRSSDEAKEKEANTNTRRGEEAMMAMTMPEMKLNRPRPPDRHRSCFRATRAANWLRSSMLFLLIFTSCRSPLKRKKKVWIHSTASGAFGKALNKQEDALEKRKRCGPG